LTISDDLTITGPGADSLTVSGNDASRVFQITGGVSVEISDMMIAHGNAFLGDRQGGGVRIDDDLGSIVTVRRCTLAFNRASNQGGAILNFFGMLTVEESTFVSNESDGGGGAITNGGSLTVVNSTFSDNSAANFGGAYTSGGPEANAIVSHSTLAFNRAPQGGGIGGTNLVRLDGNILYNPDGGNCSGMMGSSNFSSGGYNLDSDGSCGLDGPGDQSGMLQMPLDPELDQLADNGGPTQTHALLPTSPAIDTGNPDFTAPPDTDQRGFSRVVDGDGDGSAFIDIGAFEYRPPAIECSVEVSLLSSFNHDLVNVGLDVVVTGDFVGTPDITVEVFGDENDEEDTGDGTHSPDAADIAPRTLRLRSERKNNADGRVYLITVNAEDDEMNSAFDCCTVVVPKTTNMANVEDVNGQAAAAQTFCEENDGAAPAGYFVIGDGPVIGPKQ
jgi:hypothetical protein